MLQQTAALLWKEFLVEWRNKSALGAIVLYAFSTIYLIYAFQNFKQLPQEYLYGSWNILFWLVILFVIVNTISKSFYQEAENRYIYYYTLSDPIAFILAKIIYSILSVTLLSMLAFILFVLFFGNPFAQIYVFLTAMLLGGAGLATIFTLVSAIASKVENNFVLIAILGFPLVLPFMAFTIRLSELSFNLVSEGMLKTIVILAIFDAMLVVLSVILFPFIWRN